MITNIFAQSSSREMFPRSCDSKLRSETHVSISQSPKRKLPEQSKSLSLVFSKSGATEVQTSVVPCPGHLSRQRKFKEEERSDIVGYSFVQTATNFCFGTLTSLFRYFFFKFTKIFRVLVKKS